MASTHRTGRIARSGIGLAGALRDSTICICGPY